LPGGLKLRVELYCHVIFSFSVYIAFTIFH